ncbi:hypothetical protein BK049_05525 [Bacillus xiamenensis]|uniref:Uncharacterized protein n=1 Tax=Bacillus xiamenensis TaxID=1178537 RepID=A0AAC9NAC2_9BACI|nr:hypothetical protein BK049_05525 [Bacillus xiamenensis]
MCQTHQSNVLSVSHAKANFERTTIITGRRSIAGSLVGGIQETQEMLDFAAAHNIAPQIEVINVRTCAEK